MDWSDVCQIIWNGLIQVGVIRINVGWVGIFLSYLESSRCDSKSQNFYAQLFQKWNYFCAQYFENSVVSKVFH